MMLYFFNILFLFVGWVVCDTNNFSIGRFTILVTPLINEITILNQNDKILFSTSASNPFIKTGNSKPDKLFYQINIICIF